MKVVYMPNTARGLELIFCFSLLTSPVPDVNLALCSRIITIVIGGEWS